MAEVKRELPIHHVADQLRDLGVEPGGTLLVHSSWRATRPIEAGPRGLIEALGEALGAEGTLAMPSWTGDDDTPFDPAATPAAIDLGIVPQTFWRLPDVRRGNHPFAFAAQGPNATRIVAAPFVVPPHGPESAIGEILRLNGQIMLLGVGHDANTALHLAELLAGVPYRIQKHCTIVENGVPRRIDYGENDHCCALFAQADRWLGERGLQKEGRIGYAIARLMRARDVVKLACEKLRRDPFAFLHPRGSGCAECDQAWESVER